MTNPLGTADFFALEANEALDRLETLLSHSDAPPPGEVLRCVRVVRGAALMAGHHHFARAAAGVEMVARAYRDGARPWDAVVREQLGQALDELRFLVRRVRDWSEDDTHRADRLARTLENVAGRTPGEGRPTAAPVRAEPGEVSSGVRAFVAREGALVASALDRAARALRAAPDAREPLYNVLRRMQSLRGLAELAELPPLPDVLDGIEQAIGDLTRQYAPAPGAADVIEAAAHALTRLARDIAERGPPVRDAEEPRRFTDLLLQTFAVERDVVPIASLYHADDPAPMRQPEAQPHFSPPGALGPVELVSHGEHLGQTADLLAESHSATERGLRLYRLVGALRSAAHPGPDPVAGALAVFARATREALAAGVATREPGGLEACLREAGQLLRASADGSDRMALSRRLLDVAYRLDRIREPADTTDAAAPPPSPPVEPTTASSTEPAAVPIEDLAYDGMSVFASPSAPVADQTPIVPIESLAPDEPAAAAAPVSALERSFATYRRLAAEQADVAPSLGALLGRSPDVADSAVVDIIALCYRGRGALERAAELRTEIHRRLGAGDDLSGMRPMVDELLDLVPLALDNA